MSLKADLFDVIAKTVEYTGRLDVEEAADERVWLDDIRVRLNEAHITEAVVTKRVPRRCSLCGAIGHRRTTCSINPKNITVVDPQSAEAEDPEENYEAYIDDDPSGGPW